jgi:zinc finger protein
MQNVYAPSDDPNLIIEYYERTNEQNENLGINDIKTDI